ncbi:MAG: glycosyltransferase family 39 protein [Ignavibacteriae bacterium]|nr:glycosyltransferase family 39 protein [Ignavibacteriota bacterium]
MKKLFLILPIVGLAASLAISFLIYPLIAEPLGSSPMSDRYDALAEGLLRYGTLSYYPDSSPTVLRPPLHPLLLALSMAIGGENYQPVALIVQAIIHAFTVLVAVRLGFRLGGKQAGVLTGLICAIHPLLLWYSGRLIVETLLTFLFSLTVFTFVRYWQSPSLKNAALAGLVIGVGLWCKAVFIPLLILFPILIVTRRGFSSRWRHAAALVSVAVVVIAPWIVRNYSLTGRWPVLQALVGYNLTVSDYFVDHAPESPLAYIPLIYGVNDTGLRQWIDARDSTHTLGWLETERDAELFRKSTDRYMRDPLFLMKKISINSVWIWSLASTPGITFVMALAQGSLLVFSLVGAWRMFRAERWPSDALIPFYAALAYVAAHLPVFAIARFSIVLIPSLTATAAAAYFRSREKRATF